MKTCDNDSVLSSFSKALVLCAHTDDEFGCAGLVLRLIEKGVSVYYLALSKCEESVPDGYPKDILAQECIAATRALGIPENQTEIADFKVRYFPKNRQEILEKLVSFKKEFQPDLIMLPSSYDMHQDHRVVFEEGFRAFKHLTLLGYELPQNITTFSHTAFVTLTKVHIEKKVSALGNYKSQNLRNYSRKDFIFSLARVRGVQCNSEFAEAFEIIRLIIK